MSSASIPLIAEYELVSINDNSIEYIGFLLSKYHELISIDAKGQIQSQFTIEQNVLLAFQIFADQVRSGGFIQLIENGYGAYIFDSLLSQYLKEWEAAEIAQIIDEARVIYQYKKTVLEREKSLEEFAKLYQEHPEFEALEQMFNNVIASETLIIKQYIEQHYRPIRAYSIGLVKVFYSAMIFLVATIFPSLIIAAV